MQPVRDWWRDFSCLAERKLRRGMIIVFKYVKAATKRKGMCFPCLLCAEPEKMSLKLSKGGWYCTLETLFLTLTMVEGWTWLPAEVKGWTDFHEERDGYSWSHLGWEWWTTSLPQCFFQPYSLIEKELFVLCAFSYFSNSLPPKRSIFPVF